MKAATGELNLTVITIVAIGAVIAFFTAFLWPAIQKSIKEGWGKVKESSPSNDKGSYSMITGNSISLGDYTVTIR